MAPRCSAAFRHYALVLLCLVFVGGFGGMLVSELFGLGCAATVFVGWAVLVVVNRQDRVAVPFFFLRLRYRFPVVVSSYTPSARRVFLEEGTT